MDQAERKHLIRRLQHDLDSLDGEGFDEVLRYAVWARGRTIEGGTVVSQTLVRCLATLVNGSEPFGAAARAFLHEHRTLQQGIVRFFVRMLRRWYELGTKGELVDGRNEDAYKLAKYLTESDAHFRYV